MSNVAPAAWDVTTPEPAQSIAQFIVDVTVNSGTSITCVTLPHFDPTSPVKGAKAARESFIKLLSGKCDDFNPLSFRTEIERDRVTPDPYFKFAPHWSTLSGGRTPYITRKPADIARMCVEVAGCVPFIQAVRIYVIGSNGTKQSITLEELNELDLGIKPVPNLYTAATTSGGSDNTNSALLMERQRALEDALTAERTSTTALHQEVHELKFLLQQVISSGSAAAPSSAPAPETEEEVVEVTAPSEKVRGKRKASAPAPTTPATRRAAK